MSRLTAAEATELYDAYRYKADDCVTVTDVADRAVARAHRQGITQGIRFAIYEAGLWCGECEPADPDDDCCVVTERVRFRLDDLSDGAS